MNFIYFPFTTLPPDTADIMKVCFQNITVYQVGEAPFDEPAAFLPDGGSLRCKAPLTGDEKELSLALRSYKTWARDHDMKAAALIKARSGQIPFYSDTSVSKIRTDLKQRLGSQPPDQYAPAPPVDEKFTARLFLALAREHDVNTRGLIEDLSAIDRIEQMLFDRLKGEPGDLKRLGLAIGTGVKEDRGSHLTAERLNAWSILFENDDENFDLFVTDSPSVMDYLVEENRIEGSFVAPVFTMGPAAPAARWGNAAMEAFNKDLSRLTAACAETFPLPDTVTPPQPPTPEPGEKAVLLTVYIAPRIDPKGLFQCLVHGKKQDSGAMAPAASARNTVFCLIHGA